MKKYIYIALIALTSCNLDNSHEVRYSPDGTDSIAHVQYFDGDQYTSFDMPYAQFKMLYSEGGYEACYEYALQHELPVYWQRKYAGYKKKESRPIRE